MMYSSDSHSSSTTVNRSHESNRLDIDRGTLMASVLLDLPCLNKGGVRARRVSIGRDYCINLMESQEKIEQIRRDNPQLQVIAEFRVQL